VALTSLQQLHLTQSNYLRSEFDAQLCLEWEPEEKIQAALGLLLQLKHLELQQVEHSGYGGEYFPGTAVLSLPSSLTRLEVQLAQKFNSSSTPDLKSLTALQHLQLKGITELDASLLSGMTQLTHLQLQMKGKHYKDSGMDEMMRTMRQLLRLQHLELEFRGEYGSLDTLPDVSWQYTALTSSKHLTSFILKGVQLPKRSGSGLFGTQLPLLQTIQIDATGSSGTYGRHHRSIDVPLPTPFARGADISSLVRNCPELRELDIAGGVKVGVDLGKLSALSRLTSLVVGGDFVDDVCAKWLSQLSCLESLIIVSPASRAAAVPRAAADRCVGRGADATDASDADEGVEGSFTFAGLRSLMQLTSLTTFGISGDTCLFAYMWRWSMSGHDGFSVDEFHAQVSTSLRPLVIELAAKHATI
jgi:hypothetical protein